MRKSLSAGILLAPLAVVAALAVPAAADRAEDDLQLVRKAVASSRVAQARPPAEEEPSRAEATPPPRRSGPSWFRVRVVEKGARRGKVSVNLPLVLVRAFGDDWPIAGLGHGRCRKDRGCPTLGEILRALDSGQSLVEIEDDEASVRVWVE
jgi:hypothetical protein